jgi:type I restriction modification DNA specificity domain protein
MEYIRFKDVIINSQYGYTAAETSLTEGTYKYLRITDIVPYYVDFESVPFCKITEKDVSKYIVNEGDILIARTGATTGYNYVVPSGINNTVYASYLIRFVVDKKLVLPLFLKYVFKTQSYYGFVNNYIGGAAQPGMNAKVFTKFNIPKFSLITQQKIASILSAYDRLIENNTRRIRLLEQMAENLYKEWFVRFRFPGHENVEMVNGLPKGWKLKHYVDELDIRYGKGLATELLQKEGFPVFGSNGQIGFYKSYMYEDPQILISCRGASSGIVNISLPKSYITSNSLVCERTEKTESLYEYLKYYFLNNNLVQYQTGSAQPQITISNIGKLKLLIPEVNVQRNFSEKIKGIDLEMYYLQQQNQHLTRQRDLLLPRLMSGKLEVKS